MNEPFPWMGTGDDKNSTGSPSVSLWALEALPFSSEIRVQWVPVFRLERVVDSKSNELAYNDTFPQVKPAPPRDAFTLVIPAGICTLVGGGQVLPSPRPHLNAKALCADLPRSHAG